MTIKRSLISSLALGVLTAGALASTALAAGPRAAAAAAGPVTVAFSGYDWTVKDPGTTSGPGPNYWSPGNVKVDTTGRLHLKINQRQGHWYCAEVTLDRGLGYGTYRFSVASAIGALDPNVVLGLFTWSDDPTQNHRELDVEIARWGNATGPTNAQYVVQPAGPAGHLTRFTQPSSVTSSVHSFTWLPGSVQFASTAANGSPIASASYSGADVPTPGSERVHMNLWLYSGQAPTNGAAVEVTLSGFGFTPATPTALAGATTAASLFGGGPLAATALTAPPSPAPSAETAS
ncbi:MAG: glycoside hydrolase family 16 protein [Candidatus Velthaea sp.]